ncbi:hypothetical protein GO308_17205 [Sphingomonas sp. SFZ2018-12]|uniref:hypothetical protein n=1 Tax=Sphingomonas sp. SFZ2018-12 TaxID=2683197 RepID=UPI001F10B4A7|nr:hypothetical protein [Sphingomonas sp. SFZ2018-12]MCH4894845.1 hypothetical protein [Sphingomonas sp. SFZ2018-12]
MIAQQIPLKPGRTTQYRERPGGRHAGMFLLWKVRAMPWRRLFFQDLEHPQPVEIPPDLTLVTLRLIENPSPDEVAFYDEAERATLLDWCRRGQFILALCNTAGTELELLCPSDRDTTHALVMSMPFVVAGLSTFHLRPMMLLRLSPAVIPAKMN